MINISRSQDSLVAVLSPDFASAAPVRPVALLGGSWRQRWAAPLLALVVASLSFAQETFVGPFAEPADGGNINVNASTFDGSVVTIVPRPHASEAISGASRWRNVYFAIRGVQGKAPTFRLPFRSPTTAKEIHVNTSVSLATRLVWSYQPDSQVWNTFDTYTPSGSGTASYQVDAKNSGAFTRDVVYVSINERYPVHAFYDWLESSVFTHASVRATASQSTAGNFIIGVQRGAASVGPSGAISRAIPDMPLYAFTIKDPKQTPTKLVVLVSGQHPYEGQNKAALRGALEWILNSTSSEAKAYRANYVTLVYPFVNPTGELAGLWRGTACDCTKDTNRNWDTTKTDPATLPGIDTVITHKRALGKDITALGLGEPYALFDYHQNFGDDPVDPAYLLRSSSSTASTAPLAQRVAGADTLNYWKRLNALAPIADKPADPEDAESLRGYAVTRGIAMPLTFERSVYSTLAVETAFGTATVRALVTPAMVEALSASSAAPSAPAGTVIVDDAFTGTGSLAAHALTVAPFGAKWIVENGTLTLNGAGQVAATNTARAVVQSGAADVTVSTTMTLTTGTTGVLLRSSDTANYYRFYLTSTGWTLQKTQTGTSVTIASGSRTFALGKTYVLKAVLAGSSMTFSVDGVQVGAASASFNATATRHGLFASGSGSRQWDSFTVTR